MKLAKPRTPPAAGERKKVRLAGIPGEVWVVHSNMFDMVQVHFSANLVESVAFSGERWQVSPETCFKDAVDLLEARVGLMRAEGRKKGR